MRVLELRGLPVIDPRTARRVGVVSDIYVDPVQHCIAALEIEAAAATTLAVSESLTADRERVLSAEVRRVGKSAVMLRGPYTPTRAADAPAEPGWLNLDALVGLEVMSDGGDAMGALQDVSFDPDSLRVDGFELEVPVMERWFGGGGRISPEAVVSCSRELMLVRAGRQPAQEPVLTGQSQGHT
ncbi:MAG: PRC-barrel domain-containing protein [Chloroflexi bacterium]|nr:PRC-barrel domain-containing protein [Chloroflexota bacterium]